MERAVSSFLVAGRRRRREHLVVEGQTQGVGFSGGGLGRTDPRKSASITRRAAQLSVAVALVLIALKGWSWITSGSVAMLSSLADSMLDLVASLFTYFAVRYAAAPPDREHRFGHGKAESFAGLFQAGLVAVSGGLIAVEAVRRLLDGRPVEHGLSAIAVMVVSIVITGALIWRQTVAVRQTGRTTPQICLRTSQSSSASRRAHFSDGLGRMRWQGCSWRAGLPGARGRSRGNRLIT